MGGAGAAGEPIGPQDGGASHDAYEKCAPLPLWPLAADTPNAAALSVVSPRLVGLAYRTLGKKGVKMTRVLNRPVFDTLSTVDKVRAYLLLRTTPTNPRVLQRVSHGQFITAYLRRDLQDGLVRRTRSGGYLLAKKGRRRYATTLPLGLLGAVITPEREQ
jgi:hypothetical protein